MFIVMLFTPEDEPEKYELSKRKSDSELLIEEVGEISVDFAGAVVQLEQIADSMKNFLHNQADLIAQFNSINQKLNELNQPNPEMISILKQTNNELNTLRENITKLNDAADSIKRAEIEAAVRKELERILHPRI
jgi:methyl-accepting chemotaxis protein